MAFLPMEHPEKLRRLDRLDRLANTMDSAFRIPGIGVRVGWDSLIGLIPGLGDAASLGPGAWIIVESRRLGAPRKVLVRQSVNMGLDAVVGAIPLLGDLFDAGFKSNRRNVALLRQHLNDIAPAGDIGEGALSSHHPTLGGPVHPTRSSPAKK